MKALFAACCLLPLALLPAPPAAAQDPEAAAAAWERGDYAAAFDIWQALAERGDQNAQIGLVNLYTYGRGVPRDYGTAYMWLLIASAGDPAGFERIRVFLASFLTEAERQEAARHARDWRDAHISTDEK